MAKKYTAQQAEALRAKDAERKRNERSAARDISIHEPVNMQRRERCEADPIEWMRTYLWDAFFKPFSKDDISFIEEAGRILRDGGQKANAEPRGAGKTT